MREKSLSNDARVWCNYRRITQYSKHNIKDIPPSKVMDAGADQFEFTSFEKKSSIIFPFYEFHNFKLYWTVLLFWMYPNKLGKLGCRAFSMVLGFLFVMNYPSRKKYQPFAYMHYYISNTCIRTFPTAFLKKTLILIFLNFGKIPL